MKLTMHYNGDGTHTLNFRGPKVEETLGYRCVRLTRGQWSRVCDIKADVGPLTFSVDGQAVQVEIAV